MKPFDRKNETVPWMKRNMCKERSNGKGSSRQILAESREVFGRHDMRRERLKVEDEFGMLFVKKWNHPTTTAGEKNNPNELERSDQVPDTKDEKN